MTDGIRILTIEDDPTIRHNIVAYLEDSGYLMLQAPTGRQGLELFDTEQPDLVLCDLRMPDLDGLEVLYEITQTSPNTPVIIVSGAGMISDAIESLKRGAWDYVTKPIPNMQVLESAINKALERARLVQENLNYQRKLEALNQGLSTALEQLKNDQVAGRKLQSKLLPEDNLRFGEYQFNRKLYPAMYLSGDFVDYFVINERYLGFYMADVSGHDAGSAFVTIIVKSLMTHLQAAFVNEGREIILNPEQTLKHINDELISQKLEKYITLFYGVIDLESDQLRASNGGHYPFPIIYNGLEAKPLEYKSLPVGLFEDASYSPIELQLPETFLLLLMSDGIFELMPEKSNRECYKEILSFIKQIDMPLDALLEEMKLGESDQLLDDLTLLSITKTRHHD